jgi:hypothetical protein
MTPSRQTKPRPLPPLVVAWATTAPWSSMPDRELNLPPRVPRSTR